MIFFVFYLFSYKIKILPKTHTYTYTLEKMNKGSNGKRSLPSTSSDSNNITNFEKRQKFEFE